MTYLDNIKVLFIFIILLYNTIKWIHSPVVFNINDDIKTLLSKLNTLRIYRLAYECFIAFCYIFGTIIIFFIIRISFLNTSINLLLFHHININNSFLINTGINIFLTIIIMIYYVKIMQILFYPYINKIHLYLFQYKWYQNFDDFIKSQQYFITHKFLRLCLFFKEISFTIDEYRNFATNKLHTLEELEQRYTYKIIRYFSDYTYFSKIAKNIRKFLSLLDIDSRFFYYFPYTATIIIFFYDCFHGKLFLIYYALLFLFIVTTIRKFKLFFIQRDGLYDLPISLYLYSKNSSDFSSNDNIIPMNDSNEKIIKEAFIEKNMSSLLDYLCNDYIIDRVRQQEYITTEKRLYSCYKRQNLLLLFILGFLFYYKNSTKYLLMFFDKQISLWIFVLGIGVILFILNNRIEQINIINKRQVVQINFKYKRLFNILIFFVLVLMICILLKNKLMLFPTETLFSVNNCIKIIEQFSLEEKSLYIKRYIEHITYTQILTIDKYDELLISLRNIMDNLYLVSMQETKKIIEELIQDKIKSQK